ncbi:Ornithine carbamoyltransferase [Frankliniella fusca]|uniref:Ornithine carbamoyltransferase n=1 Tax=Frankliniella fusca TaxID=407009 RepID=A0AAE1I2T3_9NEOP|nr:Ornithine carbamoyltransferase [Frankliniella fusca]
MVLSVAWRTACLPHLVNRTSFALLYQRYTSTSALSLKEGIEHFGTSSQPCINSQKTKGRRIHSRSVL